MDSEPQTPSECARAVVAFACVAPKKRYTTDVVAKIAFSSFPEGFSLKQCAAGLVECKALDHNVIGDHTADQLAKAADMVANEFSVPLRELYRRIFPERVYTAGGRGDTIDQNPC